MERNGKGSYGSDFTFESLVEQYEKKIFNVVYQIIGDYDDAADLTIETFERAYESFHKFRGASSPYTWLYRIAVNLCRNKIREKKRRRELELEPMELPAVIPDWSQSPEKIIERKELQDYVRKSIQALPEDYRIVIVLRELHGLSYDEIAEVIGASKEVVKVRLFRARSFLRQKLAPHLEKKDPPASTAG